MFPALAAAYAFWCARKYFRRTLPMFAVSAVYVAIHLAAAPMPKTGDYGMHFTGAMLRTLARYWTWSAGPSMLWTPWALPQWIVLLGVAAVSLGLACFLVRRWRGPALFCVAWYLIAIAPILPLRDHRMQYYVFIPLIGICWLGGWALAEAWTARPGVRIAAAALAGLYLADGASALLGGCELELPAHHACAQPGGECRGRAPVASRQVDLVGRCGCRAVLERHPRPSVPAHRNRSRVPGAGPGEFWKTPAGFVLEAEVVDRAIERGEMVVYDVRGTSLRNITSDYAARPPCCCRAPPGRYREPADGVPARPRMVSRGRQPPLDAQSAPRSAWARRPNAGSGCTCREPVPRSSCARDRSR